jgi:hypothetical protein
MRPGRPSYNVASLKTDRMPSACVSPPVVLFRNTGERLDTTKRGKEFVVAGTTLGAVLRDATEALGLPRHARRFFSADGTPLEHVRDFHRGMKVVVSTGEAFKPPRTPGSDRDWLLQRSFRSKSKPRSWALSDGRQTGAGGADEGSKQGQSRNFWESDNSADSDAQERSQHASSRRRSGRQHNGDLSSISSRSTASSGSSLVLRRRVVVGSGQGGGSRKTNNNNDDDDDYKKSHSRSRSHKQGDHARSGRDDPLVSVGEHDDDASEASTWDAASVDEQGGIPPLRSPYDSIYDFVPEGEKSPSEKKKKGPGAEESRSRRRSQGRGDSGPNTSSEIDASPSSNRSKASPSPSSRHHRGNRSPSPSRSRSPSLRDYSNGARPTGEHDKPAPQVSYKLWRNRSMALCEEQGIRPSIHPNNLQFTRILKAAADDRLESHCFLGGDNDAERLDCRPRVAIPGPRQSGKTTTMWVTVQRFLRALAPSGETNPGLLTGDLEMSPEPGSWQRSLIFPVSWRSFLANSEEAVGGGDLSLSTGRISDAFSFFRKFSQHVLQCLASQRLPHADARSLHREMDALRRRLSLRSPSRSPKSNSAEPVSVFAVVAAYLHEVVAPAPVARGGSVPDFRDWWDGRSLQFGMRRPTSAEASQVEEDNDVLEYSQSLDGKQSSSNSPGGGRRHSGHRIEIAPLSNWEMTALRELCERLRDAAKSGADAFVKIILHLPFALGRIFGCHPDRVALIFDDVEHAFDHAMRLALPAVQNSDRTDRRRAAERVSMSNSLHMHINSIMQSPSASFIVAGRDSDEFLASMEGSHAGLSQTVPKGAVPLLEESEHGPPQMSFIPMFDLVPAGEFLKRFPLLDCNVVIHRDGDGGDNDPFVVDLAYFGGCPGYLALFAQLLAGGGAEFAELLRSERDARGGRTPAFVLKHRKKVASMKVFHLLRLIDSQGEIPPLKRDCSNVEFLPAGDDAGDSREGRPAEPRQGHHGEEEEEFEDGDDGDLEGADSSIDGEDEDSLPDVIFQDEDGNPIDPADMEGAEFVDEFGNPLDSAEIASILSGEVGMSRSASQLSSALSGAHRGSPPPSILEESEEDDSEDIDRDLDTDPELDAIDEIDELSSDEDRFLPDDESGDEYADLDAHSPPHRELSGDDDDEGREARASSPKRPTEDRHEESPVVAKESDTEEPTSDRSAERPGDSDSNTSVPERAAPLSSDDDAAAANAVTADAASPPPPAPQQPAAPAPPAVQPPVQAPPAPAVSRKEEADSDSSDGPPLTGLAAMLAAKRKSVLKDGGPAVAEPASSASAAAEDPAGATTASDFPVVESESLADLSDEEIEEEVVYVDEFGNPVSPRSGDELEEIVEYVDEDGNPIDPSELGSDFEVVEEEI